MPTRTNTLLLKATLTLLFFVSMNAAAASYGSRADRWEFFLAPMLTNSKVLQFDNGAEADISKRSSLGFGLGYNMNKHIELSVIFASSNANYTGTRIADDSAKTPEKFTSNLYTSKIDFGFTYNLFESAFTPYLSANIGSTYIDSGIPTGDLTTICWWDPWWGYVCGPHAQTYTSTEINYGAGIGLRYDFNRKLFIKGGVAKNYLDINSSNKPDFTTYQFIFGFMF
jgi:hypothetical protein